MGNTIYCEGRITGAGKVISRQFLKSWIKQKIISSSSWIYLQIPLNMPEGKRSILKNLEIPDIKTRLAGKHVLIVVRGKNYKKDLQAIRSYIREVKPFYRC